MPAVYAGEPNAPEDYETITSNGIKVYVPKHVRVHRDGIRLFMSGRSFWRRLVVTGLYA